MLKKHILHLILFLLITGCNQKDEPQPEMEGNIILLMYHRISQGEATNTYERSAADFEKDIKYLIDNNIDVISFEDISEASITGRMPSGNAAVLCFDDGDCSWYTTVKPLLLKYKIGATFFLWTYMIGHDSFLTWTEVEEMSNYSLPGGIRPFIFGSHTYSHPYLLERKASYNNEAEYIQFLDYELRESKKLIEAHTPGTVKILALPYGDGAGNLQIKDAAQRNGYEFIRTSKWGAIKNPDIDLLEIPSLPMLNDTPSEMIGDFLNNK